MSNARTDNRPRACILGLEGLTVSDAERTFFKEANPLGFILFARNVENPTQVRELVGDLRDIIGHPEAPVLIDQEGGRVQRLRAPHWRESPPAAAIGKLYDLAPEWGQRAAYLNALLIAGDLRSLGISVDCTPMLDVPTPTSHNIIGDRAYHQEPAAIAAMADAVAEGLLTGGVLPVIKHIPGHGRAVVDSHEELPTIHATEDELMTTDFVPFRALHDLPWAMTAHIVYSALDAHYPATMSQIIIQDVIRRRIGFQGVLLSDDLSMKALGGSYESRAAMAIKAGCDLTMHCNGKMEEMQGVVEGTPLLSDEAVLRVASAEGQRVQSFDPHAPSLDKVKKAFDALMAKVA